jgi:hypothetical protein
MASKQFSSQEVDEFIHALLQKHPDIVGKMHAVWLDPFADNSELIGQIGAYMANVEKEVSFYKDADWSDARTWVDIREQVISKIQSDFEK